jgi:hypothetical protein
MSLKEDISSLDNLSKRFIEIGTRVMESDNGNIFPADLFVIAAINRSMCLISGLKLLIENNNFLCAAPLVRMQIDNAARLYAGTLVEKPHKLVEDMIKGTPINKQKDRNGNLLTDSYLIKKLSELLPWITKVYKNTSGYIHLSEKHIINTYSSGEKGRFTLRIAADTKLLPESLYSELIHAFIAISEKLFDIIEGWIFSKEHPLVVQELIKQQKSKHSPTMR